MPPENVQAATDTACIFLTGWAYDLYNERV